MDVVNRPWQILVLSLNRGWIAAANAELLEHPVNFILAYLLGNGNEDI